MTDSVFSSRFPLPAIGYRIRFSVRTYEVDKNKTMPLPALVKLLHEAAMQNVLHLKLSVWDLEPHGISWVLIRMRIEVSRYPTLGEDIEIVTHPSGFDRFLTHRDYRVFDREGNEIARSSSTWLLMNMETRKIARLPQFILDFSKQMPPKETCLAPPSAALPELGQTSHLMKTTVQWHELDWNGHLNNMYYVQWIMEASGTQRLEEQEVYELDIIYKQEAILGEKIRSELSPSGQAQTLLHRLSGPEDRELAVARSYWRTKS
ncbi:MAG: acyl-ACP thioesterase domain-containing protein [Bacteroidota bacterium]